MCFKDEEVLGLDDDDDEEENKGEEEEEGDENASVWFCMISFFNFSIIFLDLIFCQGCLSKSNFKRTLTRFLKG